jgi:hypothetical protein
MRVLSTAEKQRHPLATCGTLRLHMALCPLLQCCAGHYQGRADLRGSHAAAAASQLQREPPGLLLLRRATGAQLQDRVSGGWLSNLSTAVMSVLRRYWPVHIACELSLRRQCALVLLTHHSVEHTMQRVGEAHIRTCTGRRCLLPWQS